jgi:hypothetical protein
MQGHPEGRFHSSETAEARNTVFVLWGYFDTTMMIR